MTFFDYWKHLAGKNPGLRNGDSKMTITVENFQRALEQAFQQGEEQGRESQAKATSLFDSVFGKR